MASPTLLILAALDVDTIIQVLMVLVFILLPVILKTWNAIRGGDNAKVEGQAQAHPGETSLEDQIADFLRHATEQSHSPPATPTSPDPEPEILIAEAVHAEPVVAQLTNTYNHDDEGGQHLETQLESHHIKSRLTSTSDAVEKRVHEHLDHRLGTLQGSQSEAEPKTDERLPEKDYVDHFETENSSEDTLQASDVVDVPTMLSDTRNLKTAIILNEILTPVSSRW